MLNGAVHRQLDIDLLRTFHLACELGTLRAVAERRHLTLGAVSQQIKRLETLLDRRLLERGRQPFKVHSCEQRVQANIGGLPIQIKRDRVDEVDGRLFHIDYKTGRTSLSSWAGERPDSPQVPLYAVVDNDNCMGAAFGQVRKGDTALKGIAESDGVGFGVIPADKLKVDLPPSWDAIKAHWTERLEALAKEFLAGVNHVMPKSASSCQMCHLAALCRH